MSQIFSSLNLQMQFLLVMAGALSLGSFASLLSYRLIHKQPIIFARSECINCGCKLGIKNLIPLFSWIFQCGKCSKCHSKISLRYPLIELSFLISFLTVYLVLGRELNLRMMFYFAIAATLIVMCVIDLEEYFIPNSAQYILATLATILVIMEGGNNAALINVKAAFLYAGFGIALWIFFYFTAHLEAIGIDDIKFFFIAGLMLGTKNFLTFMILSGVFGIVFGALWQKIKKDQTFPFAPALCLSAFICLLFDKKINPIDLLGSMLFFQNF